MAWWEKNYYNKNEKEWNWSWNKKKLIKSVYAFISIGYALCIVSLPSISSFIYLSFYIMGKWHLLSHTKPMHNAHTNIFTDWLIFFTVFFIFMFCFCFCCSLAVRVQARLHTWLLHSHTHSKIIYFLFYFFILLFLLWLLLLLFLSLLALLYSILSFSFFVAVPCLALPCRACVVTLFKFEANQRRGGKKQMCRHKTPL